MRRLALTLLVGPACLAESLENAPCNTADDCAGSYTCVYTETQRLRPNGVGFCRPDGACAVGLQDGCAAAGNTCLEESLEHACDPETDACFCCDIEFDAVDYTFGDAPRVAVTDVTADGSSALCIVCRSESCELPLQPCLPREDRCVLEDDEDDCGCRVAEEDVENSDCDNDDDCGSGYVCVRTLEQLEEPLEALGEDRVQELGSCQPDDDPGCGISGQNGCAIGPSLGVCFNDLLEVCNEAGQCFCCASQTESSSFLHYVYAVAEDGSSAACTACPRCDAGNTCTRESDATCELAAGSVCGCTPTE